MFTQFPPSLFVLIYLLPLLLAFPLDLLFGDPPNRFHPVVLMGSIIKGLWKKLPRPKKFRKSAQFIWGSLILFFGIILFTVIPITGIIILGKTVMDLTISPMTITAALFLSLTAILFLKLTFAARGLLKAGKEVEAALKNNNLSEARRLTAWHLVSRDTSSLSEQEICGAALESLAENVTDGFTAPVFWYLFGGLPGAYGYRYINTCDSLIAYRGGDHEWGGKAVAWVDTIANWIPARLTAISLLVGTLLSGANFSEAFSALRRERKNTESKNAGCTMSVMAGALEVRLTKNGAYTLNGLSGKAAPLPQKDDLTKGIRIVRLGILVQWLMLLLLGILVFGLSLMTT